MPGIFDNEFKREEFALGAGHLSFDFDINNPMDYTRIAVSRGGATLTVTPIVEKIAVDNVPENSRSTWFIKSYEVKVVVTALNISAENMKNAIPFSDLTINQDGHKIVVPRHNILDVDFRHLYYITMLGDYNTVGVHVIKNACSLTGLNIKYNSYKSEQGENSLEFDGNYDPAQLNDPPYEYWEFKMTPDTPPVTYSGSPLGERTA